MLGPTEAADIANVVPGWMHYSDLKWLFEQAKSIPKGHKIVELGCWLGRSTTAIMLGHPFQEDICVVDTFKGSNDVYDAPYFVTDKPPLEIFKENIQKYTGMIPRIIVGDSADSSTLFEDKSISFLFIDADHSEENVRKDIISWFPKMGYTSIIAGHDWQHGPVQNAVRGIIGEPAIMGSGYIWCFRR